MNKKVDEEFKCIKDENERLKEKYFKLKEYITTEQLYTNYRWGKEQYQRILNDLLKILN